MANAQNFKPKEDSTHLIQLSGDTIHPIRFDVAYMKDDKFIFRFQISGDTSLIKKVNTHYLNIDHRQCELVVYDYRVDGKEFELVITNWWNCKFYEFHKIEIDKLIDLNEYYKNNPNIK